MGGRGRRRWIGLERPQLSWMELGYSACMTYERNTSQLSVKYQLNGHRLDISASKTIVIVSAPLLCRL